MDALIEAVGVYETEDIAKVYWVDRNNQPRFINIMNRHNPGATSFDFCPELKLEEDTTITKLFHGGQFHSGVIQYAFTYWNLNGIETNLVHTSELFTISDVDRGGSPEEVHSCSFEIKVDNIDKNFQYLRVYAIQRTSEDVSPVVRIVQDVNLEEGPNTVKVHDDGLKGSIFPTESLLFIGGEELILGTIATKDNALFAGDITLKRPSLESVSIRGTFEWDTKQIAIENVNTRYTEKRGLYPYKPYTLEFSPIRHWKKGEVYRIGLRAQYKTGI